MVNEIFTFERLQKFFKTDFKELAKAEPDETERLKQDMFGNYLIEEYKTGADTYSLWANYLDPENFDGIEVYYSGSINEYGNDLVFSFLPF